MASGLTTTYQLPYPLQTDSVNVAGDVRDLATAVETELLLKAPLLSPELTGTPLAPTAATDTNTTQIATTEFVINQGYLKSSTASSTYAPLDSPNLIGVPIAPTATLGTDTTQIATTAYVQNELSNFVTLPDQASNGGKFLTTDGTNASWQIITSDDVSGLTDVIDSLSSTYASLYVDVISNTLTSRTLSLSDVGVVLQMNSSSANSVVVPVEASVDIPIGTQITIIQTGVGQTTIVPDSGVDIYGTPGLSLRTQWSSATIIKTGSNVWVAMGDLA